MELLPEDLLMGPALRWVWKPLLKRYFIGSGSPLVMRPGEAVFPSGLAALGLYLHVPFCRRPCAYCPYNRVAYDETLFGLYETAAHREIDLVAARLARAYADGHGRRPAITSLYIGGGTPTIVPASLARLIAHAGEALGRAGEIGVELHPAAMDDACLDALQQSGVSMVSVGVESLSDRLLGRIGRSHDAATAEQSVRRAVARSFHTVNADLMFALPGQTLDDLDDDLRNVLALGVDQITCYPIFGFPYTELGRRRGLKRLGRPPSRLLRRMLELIRRRAEEHGLVRASVWSFARPGGGKFTSTTRHHYLGIGPSAASMLPGQFRVNTFSIREYAAAALSERLPTALVMPVGRRLEAAFWLYWRAYEMRIPRRGFREAFDEEIEDAFGVLTALLRRTGMARLEDDAYCLTERSAYWIHRVQNEYALNYISRLWGRCRREPWPAKVRL